MGLGVLVLIALPLTSGLAWTEPLPDKTDRKFVHPGLLHTHADLDRMKQMVAKGAEPWKAGFEKLKAHPQSSADWRLRGPFASVVRDPRGSRHLAELVLDANAAYQNALMWAVTGDEAHAKKSVEILNAWSAELREITGKDKELGASLCGFKFVNAAEILRHAYSGWPREQIKACEGMLRTMFYPVIQDFATFANGNWDTGCMATMLGIGVFCDDRAIFDRAVDYYQNGTGNGRLIHYVINEAGQCQESGRDQGHAQLGLAHLAEACEIAWNQGLDLYGAADNRLLKGFEYTARYNLGQDVPFVPFIDTTGKYKQKAIAPQRRGVLRPIYEMVWNHYERRRGLSAPFTRQAAEKIRPEGAAFQADHPGFGTLLFSRAARQTAVKIQGEKFFINDQPTYAGRTWKGHKIEGLLFNSRMVQGIFDDLNLDTVGRWAYPDTKKWDPERNTREFIAAMPEWRRHGLLAFTLNLQGGSPEGYSKNQPWHNSAFKEDGSLRQDYLGRLEQILDKADELGMVVILGLYYFGQDERLKDEDAVKRGVDQAVDWVLQRGYRNVLIEVNNECNVSSYDHEILKPKRVHELIERVQQRTYNGRRLLAGTSYGGGGIPSEKVVRASDFLLLHGNGQHKPEQITAMVKKTRAVPGYRPMPILFNEDDHFAFDQPRYNLLAAIEEYASWGYFDYRMKGEGFSGGYQSPPIDWGISSPRKRGFFERLKEITGG